MGEINFYEEFKLKGKDFYPFCGAVKYFFLNKQDERFDELSLIEKMKVFGSAGILVFYNIVLLEIPFFLIKGLEQILSK